MTFGMKLRELRESHGLSQKALGDMAGVRQNSIARYETGEQVPAFDAVQALCAALGEDCSVFNGCDYEPVENKRGRGRPAKAAKPAPPAKKGKGK
jgi:transcriptional regulator with XRE-family HTH domain